MAGMATILSAINQLRIYIYSDYNAKYQITLNSRIRLMFSKILVIGYYIQMDIFVSKLLSQ